MSARVSRPRPIPAVAFADDSITVTGYETKFLSKAFLSKAFLSKA